MSYAQISEQAQAAIACSQIDAWVLLENDGRLAAAVAAGQPILKPGRNKRQAARCAASGAARHAVSGLLRSALITDK